MDIIRPGRGVLGALSIATRVARRQRLVCRGFAVRVRRDTHAALGVQAGDLGGGRQLSDNRPDGPATNLGGKQRVRGCGVG